MGTWIVGIALAVVVGLVIRSMIRDKKKRKIHTVRRRLQSLRRGLSLGAIQDTDENEKE